MLISIAFLESNWAELNIILHALTFDPVVSIVGEI